MWNIVTTCCATCRWLWAPHLGAKQRYKKKQWLSKSLGIPFVQKTQIVCFFITLCQETSNVGNLRRIGWNATESRRWRGKSSKIANDSNDRVLRNSYLQKSSKSVFKNRILGNSSNLLSSNQKSGRKVFKRFFLAGPSRVLGWWWSSWCGGGAVVVWWCCDDDFGGVVLVAF